MNSYYAKAFKFMKSIKYNWIDCLFISLLFFSSILLRKILFPESGAFFNKVVQCAMIGPAVYILFLYASKVRPIIFSNPLINAILLIPKELKKRTSFSIIGLFGVFFQWIGCCLIITSPIGWGPWAIKPLELSSDDLIYQEATEDAEMKFLERSASLLASAKPLDTSKMSSVEIFRLAQKLKDRKKDKAKREDQEKKFKKNFIEREKNLIFTKLKEERHKEEIADYEDSKADALSIFFKILRYGVISLFFGAVLDKVNNIIQISRENEL